MKKTKSNKELEELKSKVNEFDDIMLNLLSERKNLTKKIQQIKNELGLAIHDPLREKEIIGRLIERFGKQVSPQLINQLYELVFRDSVNDFLKSEKPAAKDIHTALKEMPIIIAGPCAIESKEQINKIVSQLSSLGVRFLRGGAFKPRTNPATFQGLGEKGLKYMRGAADKYGMYVVSEVLESHQLDKCYDLIDVIHVGSRNMSSYGFLKNVGRKTAADKKPVLLKRGFNATLKELLYAAEYITNEGNPNVMLCLRGIRTFEQIDSDMRFTPDLASILELKEKTNLKVIFDPSHSTGAAKYVPQIARAALMLGADGLLVETHFSPQKALSDGEQAITATELKEILDYIGLLP